MASLADTSAAIAGAAAGDRASSKGAAGGGGGGGGGGTDSPSLVAASTGTAATPAQASRGEGAAAEAATEGARASGASSFGSLSAASTSRSTAKAKYNFGKDREIDSLLLSHKAELEKLHALLADAGHEGVGKEAKELYGVKMDNVWLLRFLMSYGTADVAVVKVGEALAYMRANSSNLAPEPNVLSLFKALSKALPIRFIGRAKNGDTVSYTRHNEMEPALLYKELDAECDFEEFMLS